MLSTRTKEFKRRYFPKVRLADWNNWQWQLRNRFKSKAQLSRILNLSSDETAGLGDDDLSVAINPYYASLLDRDNFSQPLRRTVVPVAGERIHSPGENIDPLGEEPHRPVPAIVHRYPDRCLFLVTGYCGTYCRYCTRSRLVGDNGEYKVNLNEWQKAIDYIAAQPSIRDVLITGGDPLTLSDDKLEWVLSRLKKIPHVEFLRIGTKVPIVLPQRVTPALCRMLKKYHPLYMSVHIIHPDEITPEVKVSCGRLADAGIPLGGHTVLLAGVNDSGEVLKKLMHEQLKIRVKPYYLFHCDPLSGSAHFRTSVQKGVDLISEIRGHTTGYAVPHYAIDLAGQGGKVALVPQYIVGREGDELLVKNFRGDIYRYPDSAIEPRNLR
jgi:lysine 2,3-aminomutase